MPVRMFGIVPIEFWHNVEIRNLSTTTRLVAIYLSAGEHNTMIGCFRLPLPYIESDLHLAKRFVIKAIKELTAISFLQFDPASNYFMITNHLSARAQKWLANSNNYIAATKALNEIPDSVPFKEKVRLQLVAIKGSASINDGIDD
jgi:hypothetical protein